MRNRLKYALTYNEVKQIVNQRLVKVDGKVRTDKTYPAGFMGKLLGYHQLIFILAAMFKCYCLPAAMSVWMVA